MASFLDSWRFPVEADGEETKSYTKLLPACISLIVVLSQPTVTLEPETLKARVPRSSTEDFEHLACGSWLREVQTQFSANYNSSSQPRAHDLPSLRLPFKPSCLKL